jgi:Tol biopolymer transport system component
MGEVYRAKDSRLDRSVAIKVLTSEKVADPERKRRFVQEAKAASALNHPNIITIYEISSDNGVDFIAMEYVAGKTLDQIIPRKGLRLNEALKYAIQMADALAKAHGAGIVHRDLKPANIMVTEEGLVKVLDFGLAKLVEPTGSDQGAGTMTTKQDEPTSTEEGTILGTVAYMSPEQVEGKKVDARSDIFSFGAVLYEMVTGQRAFQGDSSMSTLAAILNKEPKPASQITSGIPRDLEKILSRCLRKDRGRRLQHMDDLKIALQELKEESDSGKLAAAAAPQRGRRRNLIWGAALLALLGGVAVAVWFYRSNPEAPEQPLTAVPLTSYSGEERQPSFSPDGNQVAFSWNGEKQDNFDIYVKLIGPGTQLRLTTAPEADSCPAWSPDGRSIAFIREGPEGKASVYLVSPLGPPERKVAEIVQEGTFWFSMGMFFRRGLAWTPDGKSLVVTDRNSDNEPLGLFSVLVESGEKQRLTPAQEKRFVDSQPAFSPSGSTLAFIREVGAFGVSDIHLLALSEDFRPIGEPKRLTFENQATFRPVWTLAGNEIIFSSGPYLTPSLFRTAASGSGKPQRLAAVGEGGSGVAISHRTHRLVYTRELIDVNIWRLEVPGPHEKISSPMRLIFSTRVDGDAQFSPDGKRIVFASNRTGTREIWICDSDGSHVRQLTSLGEGGTPRWSPDGERIAFDSNVDGQWEIYVTSANGGKPKRLTNHPDGDVVPSWSRDQKWIYFASDRSGDYQVWKAPAGGGAAIPVTRKGGFAAFESPDSQWVYYTKSDGASSLWRVPTEGGEEAQVLESVDQRAFAVAKEGIYFIPRPDSAGCNAIQFFNFGTKRIRPIATIEKPLFLYVSVSPDGRWILFSQADQVGSDLMLVENFH